MRDVCVGECVSYLVALSIELYSKSTGQKKKAMGKAQAMDDRRALSQGRKLNGKRRSYQGSFEVLCGDGDGVIYTKEGEFVFRKRG
jgi:hypothetical protein